MATNGRSKSGSTLRRGKGKGEGDLLKQLGGKKGQQCKGATQVPRESEKKKTSRAATRKIQKQGRKKKGTAIEKNNQNKNAK